MAPRSRVAEGCPGLIAALALSCLWVEPVVAQHPFTPGVAFGASIFPHLDGARRSWAVQLDLFTELSKDLDPLTMDFLRYNDIQRTIGVDQIGAMAVLNPIPLFPPLMLHPAGWVAAGVIWDGPTEFLQNDFAHGLRLLTFVPREGASDHVVFGAGADLTVSAGFHLPPFDIVLTATGGTGLSTSFFDLIYGQPGGELRYLLGGNPFLRGGVAWRWGKVWDPFYWEGFDDGLAETYGMRQWWVAIHPGALFGMPSLPSFQFARSDSLGPFLKQGGGSRWDEDLVSVRIESGSGQIAVETWNDFGYKDMGPTFGLRIQIAGLP
jgi:hypothetical protein